MKQLRNVVRRDHWDSRMDPEFGNSQLIFPVPAPLALAARAHGGDVGCADDAPDMVSSSPGGSLVLRRVLLTTLHLTYFPMSYYSFYAHVAIVYTYFNVPSILKIRELMLLNIFLTQKYIMKCSRIYINRKFAR